MASHPVGSDAPAVPLDADRLDVYRVAREFDSFAARLLPRRGHAGLRDQLGRASSSIVLNIAEGCGRFARPEKAHFYLIARGSAMECSAILDVSHSRGLITAAAHRHGRRLLVRVVQMLTRLAVSMQSVRPPLR
jgi:four helix bundle protein